MTTTRCIYRLCRWTPEPGEAPITALYAHWQAEHAKAWHARRDADA